MDIKSNRSNRDKERAKENLIGAMKAIAVVIALFIFAYGMYYMKHHRNDDLMEKIKAKKYQLFDDSFTGIQSSKVHSYKVVTVAGIYKVEVFNSNGSHSHYANPANISIVEE